LSVVSRKFDRICIKIKKQIKRKTEKRSTSSSHHDWNCRKDLDGNVAVEQVQLQICSNAIQSLMNRRNCSRCFSLEEWFSVEWFSMY